MKDYKRLTEKDNCYYDDMERIDDLGGADILYDRLAELEDKIESGELCDLEEVRKETAREILKPLYDVIMEHSACCVNLSEDIKFLMEKYGIDLEDEE